jgi:hypothetical protein
MGLSLKDGLMTEVVPPAPVVVPPAPAAHAPETFSREYVTELREEAKAHRIAAQAAKDAVKAAEEAAAAAKVKAETGVKAAQTAANERVIRAELKAAAIKAGMVDLDGLKMLDLSTVTLDDKGEVIGADALLDAAKKAKPFLFGAAVTGSTQTVPKPGEPTDKLAKDMTPAERAALRKKLTS